MLVIGQQEALSVICEMINTCDVGVRIHKNQLILDLEVTPGDYYLVLLDTVGEKDFAFGCTPFAISITLESKLIMEDPIACPDDALPPSLNVPGFIDPFGFLSISRDAHVLTTGSSQIIQFHLSQESFFRVEMSEMKRDLDLRLNDDHLCLSSTFFFFLFLIVLVVCLLSLVLVCCE